jgi:hypothetical protein
VAAWRAGVLTLAVALSGCATLSQRPRGTVVSPEPVAARPAAAEAAAPPGATAVAPAATVPAAVVTAGPTEPQVLVSPEPPLPDRPPEGRAWVWVDSEPTGAMVVVDGVPVGRTPRRVEMDVTPQGFARQGVTIRVRFVAETVQQTSVTTELVLTPLDRVPSRVDFTRERVVRRQ